MKSLKYLAVVILALAILGPPAADAGEGKGNSARRGGKAGSNMSNKGLENTNAQWSADPDRGWIRSDERHDLHNQRQATPKSKQDRGKHKGQSKKGRESSDSKN